MKPDPFHIFLEGEEPSIALSEDANNFFAELGNKVALELEQPVGVEHGELSVDMRSIVDELDGQVHVDACLSRYQKSLAWTLSWVVMDRVGLLKLASGTCFGERICLSLSSRDRPVQEYLAKPFVGWIFKTVYYAVCAALRAVQLSPVE